MSHLTIAFSLVASCVIVSSAAAEPGWPVAEPGLVFYGQINQAYLSYDDGAESRGFLTVDNVTNGDGSFLGLSYGRALDNGWNFGARLEIDIGPRWSDEVSLLAPAGPGYGFDSEDIRRAELAFSNPRSGTISVGEGDMSANLWAPDYSGTEVISGPNVSTMAGGMFLRFADGSLSDRTLSDAIGTFDSGQKFRLRYDSPRIGAMLFSGSIGRDVLTSGDNNTYVDLSARYDHDAANWDYAVTASITGIGDNEYAGILSFAYLHKPSGINLTFTASHSTIEKHYFFLKAGITRDLFAMGSTALSIDWYNNGNWAADGAETETFGLALVQDIDAANLQLYAAVRSFDAYNNLDIVDEEFQKSEAVMAGVRWTF